MKFGWFALSFISNSNVLSGYFQNGTYHFLVVTSSIYNLFPTYLICLFSLAGSVGYGLLHVSAPNLANKSQIENRAEIFVSQQRFSNEL
jgi:hypothetical protein